MRSVLRRARPAASGPGPEFLTVDDLILDAGKRQVRRDSEPVDLTTAEFDLLRTLLASAGRVVSREELFRAVLEREFSSADRGIDNLISAVRRKLGARQRRRRTDQGHPRDRLSLCPQPQPSFPVNRRRPPPRLPSPPARRCATTGRSRRCAACSGGSFLWFWLATLLLAGAVAATVYFTDPDQFFPRSRFVPIQMVNRLAAESVGIFERSGASALQDYLVNLPSVPAASGLPSQAHFDRAYLFDADSGRELAGQTPRLDPRELVAPRWAQSRPATGAPHRDGCSWPRASTARTLASATFSC